MTGMRRLILAALPLLMLTQLLVRLPIDQPLRVGDTFRLDALAGVMLIALLLGLAIAWGSLGQPLLQTTAAAVALALAYLALPLPLLALGLAAAALSTAPRDLLRSIAPALTLVAGLGFLSLRAGTWQLGDATLAAALNSISFGLILLAAVLGMGLLPFSARGSASAIWSLLVRPAWLYPLARLYEPGIWNVGWVLATACVGGVVALWAGWAAPWTSADLRPARIQAALLGGALASLGLTTEAGLAGGLVGVLAAVLAAGGLGVRRRHPLLWLVAGPVPLSLPFIALWLQISAAAAGGFVILAAALWLSGIGWAVAALRILSAGPREHPGWTLPLLALLSLLAGIASPLVVRLLISPALAQLGAGVTPYGRPVIWPWLGLEVRAAAGATASSWLSLAVAGLLLLLSAIAYLLLRLLAFGQQEGTAGSGEEAAAPAALWRLVRQSVPWLPPGEAENDDR
ncbi:MAG: hypothetical protein KatS3mg057_1847 [Herpetosiphonaceae bacterium]|nr:MAG: hypothetical protein KatS3mg057_1847 [Herpetosiphonaceae bacterium]